MGQVASLQTSRSRTCDERLVGVFHQGTQVRARLDIDYEMSPTRMLENNSQNEREDG